MASAILGRLEALGAKTDSLPPRPEQPRLQGEAFVVFHVEAGRAQSLDLAARLAWRGGRLVPFAPGADAAAAEAAVAGVGLVVLFLTDGCLEDTGVAAGVRAALAGSAELVLVHETLAERGAPLVPRFGFDFKRVLGDQVSQRTVLCPDPLVLLKIHFTPWPLHAPGTRGPPDPGTNLRGHKVHGQFI